MRPVKDLENEGVRRLFDLPVDASGILVSRTNRFLAIVDVNGVEEEVHVHDPGRLKEILYPGNDVLIRSVDKPGRRTRWDLIAGRIGDDWILIHSGYHPEISRRILQDPELSPFPHFRIERAEVSFGSSRLDYLLSDGKRQMILEVKGCSLTVGSLALFPDAPTVRGSRHLRELISLHDKGYLASLLILVLGPRPEEFMPNHTTDPDFSRVFHEAVNSGVEVKAVRIIYDGSTVFAGSDVPIRAGQS